MRWRSRVKTYLLSMPCNALPCLPHLTLPYPACCKHGCYPTSNPAVVPSSEAAPLSTCCLGEPTIPYYARPSLQHFVCAHSLCRNMLPCSTVAPLQYRCYTVLAWAQCFVCGCLPLRLFRVKQDGLAPLECPLACLVFLFLCGVLTDFIDCNPLRTRLC